MPNFVTKGVVGFLIGTGNWMVGIVPAIVSSVVPIGVWFGLLPTAQENTSFTPLALLGLAVRLSPP